MWSITRLSKKPRRIKIKRKSLIVLFALAIALVSFSCKREVQIRGVGLDVIFSDATLSDYLITDMQYKWKTKKDFLRARGDYDVFVHFWHKSNLLLHDGHAPEIPTSQWEPDKEYTYSRRVFIPTFIDKFDPEFKGEETLKLSIGFRSPYDRNGKPLKPILVKKLKVIPAPLDTPQIIYEDGWYDVEINPKSFLKRWRWTAREARCKIDIPHKDALLFIEGGVNLEVVDNPKVIFKINDMVLDEFIPGENYFKKSYKIKKEMLGEGDHFYLIISTDKTFIPAQVILRSKDERELGVQISFIYFR